MTKFIRMVALATLAMCFLPQKILAQPSVLKAGEEIDFTTAAQLSRKFTKKYKNGFLHKNPKGYMVKFSKQDLLDLINSVPETDSINFVLASFPKSEVDDLRKKPSVIFQFRTTSRGKDMSEQYVYKVAERLCPPPRSGCKVRPAPEE